MSRPQPCRLIAVAVAALLAGCIHPGAAPGPRVEAAAPDSFQVALVTSAGPVRLMVYRGWAPHGVDRLYDLIRHHYYDGARIFRVVPEFVAQFGLAADPSVTATWKQRFIPDDMIRQSNVRGTVSFASAGAGTRTAQLFINLVDNARLDAPGGGGYPPIGRVIEGMAFVDLFNSEYEELMPERVQDSITTLGNAYLLRAFPKLDYIKTMKLGKEWR